MNKQEFNKRLKAIGERINADPMKPHENRLAGPYRVVLEVSQNHINNPEFQRLVRPEEIGLPGFYDTLDEARGVLRTLLNAVFPDPDPNDIFAMRGLQWTTTRDTELVERGNLVDVWLEQTAA